MTREKVVGTFMGGDGLTIEKAEDFCRILHADAVVEYNDGLLKVHAVRPGVNP